MPYIMQTGAQGMGHVTPFVAWRALLNHMAPQLTHTHARTTHARTHCNTCMALSLYMPRALWLMSKNDTGYAGVTMTPVKAVQISSCVYGMAGMVVVRFMIDFDLAMMIAGVPGMAMFAGGCIGICRTNGRMKLTSAFTAIGVLCTAAAYGATSIWLGTSSVCGSSDDGKNRPGSSCPLPGWLDAEAVFHAGLAVSYLFMATGAHIGVRSAGPRVTGPSTSLLPAGRTRGPLASRPPLAGFEQSMNVNRRQYT